MKAKLINPRLYLETLRQLKLLAIVMAVIMAVIQLLPVIVQAMNDGNYGLSYTHMPSAMMSAPILLAFMYLGPLALTMRAFGFLNRRSSSDFYHSLPTTRLSLYTTIALAVISIVAASILSTLIVAALSYLITGLAFNYGFLLPLFCTYFVGALIVAGSVMTAMAITGTYFTNFIVSGLILFLPRFIMMIVVLTIDSRVPMGSWQDLGFLLSPTTNIATAFPMSVYNSYRMNFSDMFFNTGAIVYSLLLGVLLIALGAFLFKRRRSEIAEHSAPNKIMQHIYRCALTLPVLLIFVAVGMSGDTTAMIVGLVLSLIVYFGYELITMKSARTLLKSSPLYLAVVALAFIISFGSTGIANAMLGITPSADEIASVGLRITNPYNESAGEQKSYAQYEVEKLKLNSPELRLLVSDALKSNVDKIKAVGMSYTEHTRYVMLRLKSGQTITRNIEFTPSEFNRLTELVMSDPGYETALKSLPDRSAIQGINFERPDALYAEMVLSKETWWDIWESFCEESGRLSAAEFSLVIGGDSAQPIEDYNGEEHSPAKRPIRYGSLMVWGYAGNEAYLSTFNLTSLTPKTAEKLLDTMYRGNHASIRDAMQRASDLSPGDQGRMTVELSLFGMKNEKGEPLGELAVSGEIANDPDTEYPSQPTSETLRQMLKLILSTPESPGKLDEGMVMVSLSGYMGIASLDEAARAYRNYGVCPYAVSRDILDQLVELAGKNIMNQDDGRSRQVFDR